MGEILPDPNGEDCAKPGDEDCDGVACSDPLVTPLFGDSSDQRVTSMAVDKDGNTVIAGYFQGTLGFGTSMLSSAGNNDYFVAKFDPMGAPLWARRYGDTGNNGANLKLTTDPGGNIVLAGSLSGGLDFGVCGIASSTSAPKVVVAKLNPQGNCQWIKTFGSGTGGGQHPADVSCDATGAVLVAGTFDGSMTFGSKTLSVKLAGYPDIFAAKLNSDGTSAWATSFSHTMTQGVYDRSVGGIAANGNGDAILAGHFYGTLAVGGTTLTENKGGSVFLAKLDRQTGSTTWAHAYVGSSYGLSQSAGVRVGGNMQIVVTGYIGSNVNFGAGPLALQGLYDGFVATFGDDGTPQWSMRFGDPNDASGYPDSGTSVATDKDGNVLLTGYAYGTISFANGPSFTAQGMRDVFLAKLSPSGTHLWSKLFGDGTDQVPGGVGADPNTGRVVLAGSTQGNINFGMGAQSAVGGYDIFLATFQP